MMFLTFALILLVILIYKRREHMLKFNRLGIPGPDPNFILGNIIEIGREGMKSVFPKWTKQYGPIVGFYIGGRPHILVSDLELIRRVMIKDFHIFTNKSQCVPGGIHPAPELQTMITWATDNTWRNLRASVSPSFSPSKLSGMTELVIGSINKMAGELNDKAESGEEFNVKPLIYELAFSSAVKCIFGLDYSLHKLSKEAKSFLESTKPKLENSILASAMVLFPSVTFIAHPLRVLWERIRLHMMWSPEGVAYNVAKKIVATRRETKSDYVDFLHLLMNAKRLRSQRDTDLEMSSEDAKENHSRSNGIEGQNISEVEILSNAMVFLLASFETTATTLQFTLHNLINHQDIQEQLRNDLREAVGNDNGNILLSTVSKVPLLVNVIKESLRMFPPVSPFTTRVASRDYKYEDILIPKGTSIYIAVHSIHNDPDLWPEPEAFRPERFDNEFDKLTFLPFGVG